MFVFISIIIHNMLDVMYDRFLSQQMHGT